MGQYGSGSGKDSTAVLSQQVTEAVGSEEERTLKCGCSQYNEQEIAQGTGLTKARWLGEGYMRAFKTMWP